MIQEIFKQIFYPCPFMLKRMGFLSELIAIEARHQRQKLHWENHLRNSRFFILKEAQKSPKKNRITLIGVGHLLDVPLEELLKEFQEIILVDIVLLPKLKKRFAGHPQVKLIQSDISGVVEQSYKHKKGSPLPLPQAPSLPTSDVVVSVNLLSQLPLLPMEYLNTEDKEWGKLIIEKHLEFLKALAPLNILLCETNQLYRDRNGQLIEDNDMMFAASLPPHNDEWTWVIAPLGEASYDYSIEGRVKAFVIQN